MAIALKSGCRAKSARLARTRSVTRGTANASNGRELLTLLLEPCAANFCGDASHRGEFKRMSTPAVTKAKAHISHARGAVKTNRRPPTAEASARPAGTNLNARIGRGMLRNV